MARPIKSGLDYFPMDVDMNTSMKLFQAEYGLIGFAVIVKLWSKIYKEEGYYCNWNYDISLLFSQEIGLEINSLSKYIDAAFRRELFDKSLYDKYSILTSSGVQKRYFSSVKKRKSVSVFEEFILIKYDNNGVYVDDNLISVNIISHKPQLLVEESTQRKVKKSKVKNNKENNISSDGKSSDEEDAVFISIPLKDGTFHNVYFSQVEHYKKLYPEVDVKQELRNMLGWSEANKSNRKTRTGIERFINAWLTKTQRQGGIGYGADKGHAKEKAVHEHKNSGFRTQNVL